MRVNATGKDSRSSWTHVWTIDGGKIRQMREYVDTFAVTTAYAP